MQTRNDSFPFMSDDEVKLYWEAVGLPEDQRTQEQQKAVSQKYNEADLVTLNELMEKLRDGHEVSPLLEKKLESLYRVTDAERLTA
jgi:urease gamma subunit